MTGPTQNDHYEEGGKKVENRDFGTISEIHQIIDQTFNDTKKPFEIDITSVYVILITQRQKQFLYNKILLFHLIVKNLIE